MEYTKEEKEHMLAYAREWYPTNTKFKSTYNNKGCLTVGVLHWGNTAYGGVIQNFLHGDRYGWIFSDGKWAEIIDGPQPPPYIPLDKSIRYEIY